MSSTRECWSKIGWFLNLKAYVFDLDGTLVDTEQAHLKAWSKALNILLQDNAAAKYEIDLSIIQRHFGKSTRDLAMLVLKNEDKAKRCEELKEKIFTDLWPHESKLMPCAKEILVALKRRGVKTAVASSNSPERITEMLKHFNLLDMFDAVIGLDESIRHKPYPDLLLRALNLLSIKPSEAVYIGDSPYDVLMAKKAGSYSILVKVYERIKLEEVAAMPDAVVKSLCDLYNILI